MFFKMFFDVELYLLEQLSGIASRVFKKKQLPFSQGIQKEKIKQRRQTRLRPGEKETLNITLRENIQRSRLF